MPSYSNVSYSVSTRTFNMNASDATQSSEVVSGMISINAVKAEVLIDSGATRSFISECFIDKIKCDVEPLQEPLAIIVVNQDKLTVSRVCPRCVINVSGCLFPVNLTVSTRRV